MLLCHLFPSKVHEWFLHAFNLPMDWCSSFLVQSEVLQFYKCCTTKLHTLSSMPLPFLAHTVLTTL
jgi:hypothetical protein